MTEKETMIQTLKAQAADRYEVSLSEVSATPAPNGGTVIWHEYCDLDQGIEDDFCLCWVQADGTVLWNEYAYDLTPDGQEPLEWQAGF